MGIGRSARQLSQMGTGRLIFSAIFWLSVIDRFGVQSSEFWSLGAAWAAVLGIGRVNWETVWRTARGEPVRCQVQGLVGPSRLLLAAPDAPSPGTFVRVTSEQAESSGIVLTRIRRLGDTWTEVQLSSPTVAEELLEASGVRMVVDPTDPGPFVGAVDVGTSDQSIVFTATAPLVIGKAVAVLQQDSNIPALFQVTGAEVKERSIKGGSHLTVRTTARAIGAFDGATLRLNRQRWVAEPGAPVLAAYEVGATGAPPDHWLRLGEVIGSSCPLFLDCDVANEGHLAILGMTKMGKTTFALRLARHLGQSRPVVILDQTGEYKSKHGVPIFAGVDHLNNAGICVRELPKGQIGAVWALEFFKKLAALAEDEYAKGKPLGRTVLLEEAHQFIPEPAGMGFGSPGREESYELGLLMMQVRKYGISVVLISQRTAVVAKSALSQCENLIAFRSLDQTGLDYLEAVGGVGTRTLLPRLMQGEALVMGPASTSEEAVAITVSMKN